MKNIVSMESNSLNREQFPFLFFYRSPGSHKNNSLFFNLRKHKIRYYLENYITYVHALDS